MERRTADLVFSSPLAFLGDLKRKSRISEERRLGIPADEASLSSLRKGSCKMPQLRSICRKPTGRLASALPQEAGACSASLKDNRFNRTLDAEGRELPKSGHLGLGVWGKEDGSGLSPPPPFKIVSHKGNSPAAEESFNGELPPCLFTAFIC